MYVNEEVKRLRVCVADAAADADRAQKDLRRLTHQLQEEKTQHAQTQTQMNTIQQQHQRDGQVHNTHSSVSLCNFSNVKQEN